MIARVAILPAAALVALAGCADRDATGTDGSESDFASRIGAGNAAPATGATPAAAASASTVQGPPPAGANVFAMEQLGNIGGVDLGPRSGGCTFSENGKELLIAAGAAERTLPGKAVVRIGGRLVKLDAPPGGIAAIKSGTSFQGEGFSVAVRPTAPGKASITITNAAGQTKAVAGDYVCA